MKQVTSIKEINYLTAFGINVPFKDKIKLFNLGMHSGSNNDSFKEEPTKEQIKKAAQILEKSYGRLTAYYLWPCKVCSWRIVFGNPIK